MNTRNDTRRIKPRSSRSSGRFPNFFGIGPVWSTVLIVVVAIIVVFGLAVFIDAGVYYNKIHSGVSIAGQDVGGLTHDEAVAAVDEYLNVVGTKPITVVSGDKTWKVTAMDVGTSMDVETAVSEAFAMTRDSNALADVGSRWKLYFDHRDIPLQGTIDSTKMDAVLAEIALELDVAPADAFVTLSNGQLEVTEAQVGSAVDQESLRRQIKDLVFAFQTGEITVPIVVTQPSLTAADLRPVLDQAQTIVGSPVQLTHGDETWTLAADQMSGFLDVRQEEVNGVTTSVPFVSAEKMGAFFDSIEDVVAVAPVDAYFKHDGTKAWVEPGVDGERLDREKTAEAVSDAALDSTGRVAGVVVTAAEPDLTTEEAEAMGVKDLLAKYSTEYWGSSNRRQNVRMATQYCSNILMAPGDEFNVDEQIGPRTAARGFLTAPGIVGPGKLEDVYGGGICQVSTTIFNTVFFAGLEVTERHNHSIYIDHYPKGRDATVTAGGKNLRFKNDTEHYIWIMGESTGAVTTFYIYGTDDGREVSYTTSDFFNVVGRSEIHVEDPTKPEGYTEVETGGQSGKQCVVTRTITWADGTSTSEKFNSYWPMIPRKVIIGTGTTTTTEGPSTTEGPPTTSAPPTTAAPPPTDPPAEG